MVIGDEWWCDRCEAWFAWDKPCTHGMTVDAWDRLAADRRRDE